MIKDGRMIGRTDGRQDGQRNVRTNEQTSERTKVRTNVRRTLKTDGAEWADGRTDGHVVCGRTDRYAGGRLGGRTDMQTDRPSD